MTVISKDIDPDIRRGIVRELADLEKSEEVYIFLACESGSRAWGFPSKDSDYDVRFLYIHPSSWYLSIDDRRDVIERPITDKLDLSGWDIRKGLKLLRKSNPPLLEWLRSPIIYMEKSEIAARMREMIKEFYSPRSCMHHYLHMARGNFREYLKNEKVKVKKYFYVLRPILGCLWIEADLGPVPMEFAILVDRLIRDDRLKSAIQDLLERKKSGHEMAWEPKIPVINHFLEEQVERLDAVAVERPVRTDRTSLLDDLFRQALEEVW